MPESESDASSPGVRAIVRRFESPSSSGQGAALPAADSASRHTPPLPAPRNSMAAVHAQLQLQSPVKPIPPPKPICFLQQTATSASPTKGCTSANRVKRPSLAPPPKPKPPVAPKPSFLTQRQSESGVSSSRSSYACYDAMSSQSEPAQASLPVQPSPATAVSNSSSSSACAEVPPRLPQRNPPSSPSPMTQQQQDDESGIYEDIDLNWTDSLSACLQEAAEESCHMDDSVLPEDCCDPQPSQSAAASQTSAATSPVPDDPSQQRPPSRPPRPRRRRRQLHRSADNLHASDTVHFLPYTEHTPDSEHMPAVQPKPASSSSKSGLADGLLRIKGDIQVNLAKQVGNIRLKVSQSGRAQQQQGMTNSVHVPVTHQADDDLVDYDWSDVDVLSGDDDDEADNQQQPYPGLQHSGGSSPVEDASVPPAMIGSVHSTSTTSHSEPNLTALADSDDDDESMSTSTALHMQHSFTLNQEHDFDQPIFRPGSCAETVSGETSSGESVGQLQHEYQGRFGHEPLYQHIMFEQPQQPDASNVCRVWSMSSGSSRQTSSTSSTGRSSMRDRFTNASQLGSQRSLWCELPEVIESGCLQRLTSAERKRQEAMFELLTSEASYLRSLNMLLSHFMANRALSGNKALDSVIDKRERKHLFSNILAVRDSSEALLCELELLLDHCCMLDDVCAVLCQHLQHKFHVYVNYCTNQLYQDRVLKRLKATNTAFLATVQVLEADRRCEGLDLRSFLMLPLQRVTRYPLLVMAILDRTDSESAHHTTITRTLQLAHQVVGRCNEGAHQMERMEQLVALDKQLVYRQSDMKRLALVSADRHLVRQGALYEIVRNADAGGRLFNRRKSSLNLLGTGNTGTRLRRLHLLLFTDLLVVTKPKVDGLHMRDYASRAFVHVQPLEVGSARVPPSHVACLPGQPHLFACTIMCGARGKQTELLLCADSESDRQRWLNACRPPEADNPDETVYAAWDCPRVRAVHDYSRQQNDELSLRQGDEVDVTRKMHDGWYEGRRLADGAQGWFPSSYVVEVLNDHVRARNYRQRLKLIHAAESLQLERGSTDATADSGTHKYVKNRLRRGRSQHADADTLNNNTMQQRLRRLSNPLTSMFTVNHNHTQSFD